MSRLTVTDARIFENNIGECVSIGVAIFRIKEVLSDSELEVEEVDG